jgi:hypothetical protein
MTNKQDNGGPGAGGRPSFDDPVFVREFNSGIIGIMRDCIANAIGPLKDRIEKLEARGDVRVCGVWQENCEYVRGNMAVCSDRFGTRKNERARGLVPTAHGSLSLIS